jgi:16S rRNA (cytosine967-C5)-methyltransferase
MNAINERKLAVKILTAITYQKAYLNDELTLRAKSLEHAQKAYIHRVVHGVIEHKLYLDHFLQAQSKIKLKKIRDNDLNILRLALYEMLFMDSIPRYASVNEAIRLMKKSNQQLVKFANGILRNFSNNLDELKDEFDKDLSLSVKYSHPQWLVDLILEEYGEMDTEKILESNNQFPTLSIRVNTLKTNRDDVMKTLREMGFEVVASEAAPEGILIQSGGEESLFESKLFTAGFITVQDQSSMMVAHLLDPKSTDSVLDLCSAPGGKTTHIAQLMNDKGIIDARDVSYEKLYMVRENLDRLDIKSVNLNVGDARVLDYDAFDAYDRVLLDAPCSGLGIIRRKPDIRWQRTEDDLTQLSEIQLEMLENASKYVKIGGVIIYSTCTITKRENEEVAKVFLSRHPEFEMDRLPEISEEYINDGQLKIMPHLHGMDGFYACRLKRLK